MAWLAAAEESEAEFRHRLRSAATYLALVLLFSMALVVFIVAFVVPTFSSLFRELGVALPLPTRVVLAAASPAAPVVQAALVAAGAGLLLWSGRRRKGRSGVSSLLHHVRGLGRALAARDLARLLSSLATLLKSGYPLPAALAPVAPLAATSDQALAWEEARRAVLAGQPLSASPRVIGALPAMAVQLLASGEGAGLMDEMLDRAAGIYSAEAQHSLDRLALALEPVLIVAVGGLVATVAATLFLPVFRLVNALGGKM